MKRILLSVLLLINSICSYAQEPTKLTNLLDVKDVTINIYSGNKGTERIEVITPLLSKRQANKQFNSIIKKLGSNPRYTRIQGGKTHILFMEDNDIDKMILITKANTSEGYLIILAYDYLK